MMFQLEAIKAADTKVKSGTDFPKYIQDLIQLGVMKYDTFVKDGHTLYFGNNNYEVESEPKYTGLAIADMSNAEKFRQYLKIHQQGQTDYPTFCSHAAETGVEKWTVDTWRMTCTYCEKHNQLLEEKIPVIGKL